MTTKIGSPVQFFDGTRENGALVPRAAVVVGFIAGDERHAQLTYCDPANNFEWAATSAMVSEFPAAGSWMPLTPDGHAEAVNFLRGLLTNTETGLSTALEAARLLLGVPK